MTGDVAGGAADRFGIKAGDRVIGQRIFPAR